MFTDFCIRAYVNLTSGISSLKERSKDQSGAGAAEYLLILGIIAVVVALVFSKQLAPAIEKLGKGIEGIISGAGDDACKQTPAGKC